jgi:Transposase
VGADASGGGHGAAAGRVRAGTGAAATRPWPARHAGGGRVCRRDRRAGAAWGGDGPQGAQQQRGAAGARRHADRVRPGPLPGVTWTPPARPATPPPTATTGSCACCSACGTGYGPGTCGCPGRAATPTRSPTCSPPRSGATSAVSSAAWCLPVNPAPASWPARLRTATPRSTRQCADHTSGGCSNGLTEALNLLIKKVKRVGHGFGNFATFRLRLLWLRGRSLQVVWVALSELSSFTSIARVEHERPLVSPLAWSPDAGHCPHTDLVRWVGVALRGRAGRRARRARGGGSRVHRGARAWRRSG